MSVFANSIRLSLSGGGTVLIDFIHARPGDDAAGGQGEVVASVMMESVDAQVGMTMILNNVTDPRFLETVADFHQGFASAAKAKAKAESKKALRAAAAELEPSHVSALDLFGEKE
jgi:hypothetical protein